MRGAEQHDAADVPLAPTPEQSIGARRHHAAVVVAGMWGDQQLRQASSVVVRADAGEIIRDLRAQRPGCGGGEQTVDNSAAYGKHGALLPAAKCEPDVDPRGGGRGCSRRLSTFSRASRRGRARGQNGLGWEKAPTNRG